MATNNLISKTLGDIFLQSGDGTPSHSANTGSLYFDSSSRNIYKFSPIFSGGTSALTQWEVIPENISLSIVSTASTTNIVTAAVGTWYNLSSSTYGWNTLSNNGFLVNAGLATLTGSSGLYFVNTRATVKYSATLANYRIGISKNNANPAPGYYASGTISSTTGIFQTINAYGFFNLVSGDTISLAFNSPNVASSTSRLSGASINIELVI